MATKRKKKLQRYADGSVDAEQFLEGLTGGPLTFAEMLRGIIEKARRSLSPARAAEFARVLGYGEAQFVRLALQAQLDAAGLPYRVSVDAA